MVDKLGGSSNMAMFYLYPGAQPNIRAHMYHLMHACTLIEDDAFTLLYAVFLETVLENRWGSSRSSIFSRMS